MATYTLRVRNKTRTFWCPPHGGYVREVSEGHWGTLGWQVSETLAHTGDMMTARPETLARQIRRARRRELRELRKF